MIRYCFTPSSTHILKQVACVICLLYLSACAPTPNTPQLPTQTLIRATHTATATVTPTPSPTSNIPTPIWTRTPLPTPNASDSPILTRIKANLSALLGQVDAPIQVLDVTPTVWTNAGLNCGVSHWDEVVAGEQYRFLVGNQVYTYHATATHFIRCGGPKPAEDDLLLAIDPIAVDMLALAQRQIAQQLDLPLQRIERVSIRPYNWPDSGLGCPQTGVDYVAGPFGGYRIVVQAGEQMYLFHTSENQLFACSFDQERLP